MKPSLLFPALPGHWTPILPASELGASPKGVTLAGEKLVLFRGKDGVGALLDRCPHRGVALSLGTITDGCLACPFHGWRFGADGACEHVPFNPDVPRGPLATAAAPAREAMGMIWVYTGTEAVGEPILPEAATWPQTSLTYLYEDWDTHWTRVMENMLDTPHLPFVHRGTIGAGMARRMKPDSKMEQTVTEIEHGLSLSYRLDDAASRSRLDWVRPNAMVLRILDQPGRALRLHVWCIPLEADRTRLLVVGAYSFGALSPLAALTSFTNRKIVFEDRAVVESSDPKEVPQPAGEANVPTDKMTLRFRAWYHAQKAERPRPSDDA